MVREFNALRWAHEKLVDAITAAVRDGRSATMGQPLDDVVALGARTVALHDALLELAIASDFHTELAGAAPRFRAAVTAAWQLVDPSGSILAEQRRLAGCVDCGDELDRVGVDLCEDCTPKETVEDIVVELAQGGDAEYKLAARLQRALERVTP